MSDYDDTPVLKPGQILTYAELEYAREVYSFQCWCEDHKDCVKCGCECHLVESAVKRG